MRLAQIYHKVTDCCIWPNLYYREMNIRSQNETTVETWSSTLGVSPTGSSRGCHCQCGKGTQDTDSSISNDTLKPNYQCKQKKKKNTSYNFLRFLHMPSWWKTFLSLLHSYVILMNDLATYMWVCFSKSFSQTSLAHPDFKVLDLNIHENTLCVSSLKVEI